MKNGTEAKIMYDKKKRKYDEDKNQYEMEQMT